MSRYSLEDIVRGFQLMAERNDVLQDTHGNLSTRFLDTVYIKPSGVPYRDIKEKDVCVVNMDGTPKFPNQLKPSVDLIHHLAIYRNFPELRAICHTHSPYATAHAMADCRIACRTTEQADYFGGMICCERYASLDEWGSKIESVQRKAVLLENHGALTFSKISAVDAVKLAIALENVARKNSIMMSMNVFGRELTLEEAAHWHERYNNVYGQ